ncbi:XdhC family protein [Rhodococcus sp. X156]|uniref:XdhC family protein n=1 Tax=Rhodococcus sp. X156 TaxID=2499145 RepID=UPI000FDAE52A|nr:XdhC family protein [Rhodococcus sp. X156]
MRDVLDEAEHWWRRGEPIALATVVGTWKSSPRQAGASMMLGGDGAVVGSVSGGCVEGAVYELAQQVVADGVPQLQRYGVSDDDAFTVGLTCGGILDVFVERIDPTSFPELGEVAEAIRAGVPVAVATTTRHPDPARVGQRLVLFADSTSGTLGSARSDAAVTDDGRGLLAAGRNAILEYGPDGERLGDGMEVFVSSYAPRARMLVFGAIDFAAAAAKIGAFLGYRVTVCDARAVFATPQRFPDADEVVVEWPHRYLRAERDAGRLDGRTVLAVLTHDPKFDVPLLELALGDEDWKVRPAYVGAMGSRRTHDDREARLRERGVTDAQLARLHSPIGLNLGARTPEETAVSIAAEIIAARWGGDGVPLTRTDGAIHRPG